MAYKHIAVAVSGNEEDAILVNKAPRSPDIMMPT